MASQDKASEVCVDQCAVTGTPLDKVHADFFNNRIDLPYGSTPSEWQIIMTYEEIKMCMKYLAHILNEWYRTQKSTKTEKVVKFITTLNGAFPTTACMSIYLDFPCEFIFIKAASYDGEVQRELKVTGLPSAEQLSNHSIIIIDELWETGNTMLKIRDKIRSIVSEADPKGLENMEIKSCVFICKHLKPDLDPNDKPNFISLHEFATVWLVGFGLDADQECRGWRHIVGRCDKEKADNCRQNIVQQVTKMIELLGPELY